MEAPRRQFDTQNALSSFVWPDIQNAISKNFSKGCKLIVCDVISVQLDEDLPKGFLGFVSGPACRLRQLIKSRPDCAFTLLCHFKTSCIRFPFEVLIGGVMIARFLE